MRKIQSVVADIFDTKYFEAVFHWRSSSFQEIFLGRLPSEAVFISRNFNILRLSFHRKLSSIQESVSFKFEEDTIRGCWDIQLLIFWGRLPLGVFFISRHFYFLFGPLSINLKFEEDPIRGCWDILLLIFWGRLPLKVVFISRIFKYWFGPLNIDLKPEEDPISGYWAIQFLLLWGRLPLEDGGRLHFKPLFTSVWSP